MTITKVLDALKEGKATRKKLPTESDEVRQDEH
jgi:hypothetical protein